MNNRCFRSPPLRAINSVTFLADGFKRRSIRLNIIPIATVISQIINRNRVDLLNGMRSCDNFFEIQCDILRICHIILKLNRW